MTKIRVQTGSLGDALRRARRLAKISQGDLAERAGLHRNAISGLEAGRGSLTSLLAAADVLGLRLDGRSLPPGDTLGLRLGLLRRRRSLSLRLVAGLAGISGPSVVAALRGDAQHLAVIESVGRVLGAGLCLVPADQPIGFWCGAGTSSAHHGWETPSWLLEFLYIAVGGGFDLDPCSAGRDRSRVRARVHLTTEEDGLRHPWFGRVFVNPPYGRVLGSWVSKCRSEVVSGNANLVIALVPARPDTRWWHDHVVGHTDIWMLKGRLAFGDGLQAAPFPSALVAWGATNEQRNALTVGFPDAWHVARSLLEDS